MAERNPGIDSLRGVSILLVVLHHVGIRIPLRKTALAAIAPKALLSALNYYGYEAVFVFFVISGFLITRNAWQRWGSLFKLDVKQFYRLRASRIVPCLFGLIAVLSALHLLKVHDYTIERAGQSLPRAIVSALALHLNWYEGKTGYLPGNWDVLWSLSIEEVFYLCFPLLCLLTRRKLMLVPALAVLAVSLPWTHAAAAGNEIWQEKAYLPGMAAIATGVLAAIAVDSSARPRAWLVRCAWLAGAAGLCAVFFAEDLLWPMLGESTMLLLTFSAALLVVASQEAGSTSPHKAFGWLRSWGRLSYEIYLTHMFVVFAVVRAFRASGGAMRPAFLWYLPALALSWALGAAVARWFSIPAERALRAHPSPRG